ncbi:hypothetical protein PFY12_14435 [Chryseobacterium camelliae]|uniref:Uncharacterized protein n=1 Tax=Chryseobacterium camelliae TaxID=1265445 RepID=A0ABY7QML3_9FLAO|nr:hypothetical protein [Chryseobacterium camelliae]WBV60222.1 hypothetical protein PFY12_14435 [Chryseobacterium camelliae]
MAKIIEVYQKNKIECDQCFFVVKNEIPSQLANIDEFVNKACPKCDANLCTPKDYTDYLKFIKLVNRTNKYLGWLGYFFGSQTINMGESVKVKIHDGINIIK